MAAGESIELSKSRFLLLMKDEAKAEHWPSRFTLKYPMRMMRANKYSW